MTNTESISPETLEKAARLLREGGLVAFPTETVYGLGASALDGRAVARIFEAKGRPRFNPLIVHVASMEDALRYGIFSAEAEALARAFWPGPLTLVVPRREEAGLCDLVSAGLSTVALRMPAHEVARALIAAAGVPVAAPSANRSGRVSATTAAHVAADFGRDARLIAANEESQRDARLIAANEESQRDARLIAADASLPDGAVDAVLDGGPCVAGIESTIVGLAGGAPVLLRAGAVARRAVEDVLGVPLTTPGGGGEHGQPQAPGMLSSHYAPRARVRLNAATPRPGEAYLAFGEAPLTNGPLLNLSEEGDLREAAANLFAHLRALDATGAPGIAVAPIPAEGLGEAINDRLRRAAAPRP